jgi:hydrogenase large subunit
LHLLIFCKALNADFNYILLNPRYDAQVYEVGPLARMVSNYLHGDEITQELVDGVLDAFSARPSVLFSVPARHAARALEAKLVADAMDGWLGEPVYVESDIPRDASGIGLTEAPRGALGHWIDIKNRDVEYYLSVRWSGGGQSYFPPTEPQINQTVVVTGENKNMPRNSPFTF